MKVTKIEQQKKRKNRYSIFIEDEFAFGVDENTLLTHNIQKGDLLNDEKISLILQREAIEQGKEKALRLLAYRARTKHEIETRLYPMDKASIDEVVKYLDAYGYLNDREFAEMFIQDALHLKGWGEKKIHQGLYQKGVSKDIINTLEIPAEEIESVAREVLSKRLEQRKNRLWDKKEENRTISFMLGRGFSYDIARSLLAEMKTADLHENDI